MWQVTDEQALREAARLRPDEDMPKLMLADVLEESDRPDEAQAVRRMFEERQRVELSKEQSRVAEELVTGVPKRRLQTLGGYAGTGKTTVAAEIHRRLPNWSVCAYTGKAADMLRRKGLTQATTIHGAIYYTHERDGELVHERKAIHAVQAEYDGFLIYEASTVPQDMLADLMAFGLPIIAIGDHGQLPPVGDDAGLMKDPMFRLETVHRNAGPIAYFAEHMRKGGRAKDWPNGNGIWIAPKKQIPDRTLRNASQVICAFNKTRVAMNRRIRELQGHIAGELFRKCDPYPRVGDRVMCLKNSLLRGVFNGQQGRIANVKRKGERILFQPDFGGPLSEKWIEPHPEAWNAVKPPKIIGNNADKRIPFDYAWCVTCHKMQGDESAKVVVFEERCEHWEHARWAYTAASRAKEAIVWGTTN